MAIKHYDEATCVKLLMKKNEIDIDTRGKMIHIVKEPQNIGIRSWGKIDYLCHYCGYRYGFTKAAKTVKVNKKQASNEDIENYTKIKKNKINLANSVKGIMKKVKSN